MSTRDHASTFAKGLEVLSCFETGARDLTMAEIANQTGFDRAVARRLCLTLETEGYVTRAGKFLRLTPKILTLAGGFLNSEGIGRIVQPILNQGAEDLNGELALAALDSDRAIYVARSAVGSARLSLGFSVGSTLPLHNTAVGHMLLASCDEDRRDRILQQCYETLTKSESDFDLDALQARIVEAKTQGFAYLSEDFEAGAAGLAVSVKLPSPATYVLATSASAAYFADETHRQTALDTLYRAAHTLRSR